MSKFKVGDRVRAVGCLRLSPNNVGKIGTVYSSANGLGICVDFGAGDADYGRHADFELVDAEAPDAEAPDAMALKTSLQDLHKKLNDYIDNDAAYDLAAIISEHFGVTWQAPHEGRWVEKVSA